MSVKPISQSMPGRNYSSDKSKQRFQNQSFTGGFNPVVTLMDAIDKGGFAASFIAQDGIGMVAPRIYEGLNRNRKKDEHGHKTGPLNWEFARREGVREILSGPSAFLIPMGIMAVIKKTSGAANNVHVDHINALGQNFAQYALEHKDEIADSSKFKKGFYKQIFENTLKESTTGLDDSQLAKKAEEYADKLVNVETKRAAGGKENRDAAKTLYGELVEDYMKLRKQHAAPSVNEYDAELKLAGKSNLRTNIERLTQSLTEYSDDALDKTNKYMKKFAEATPEQIKEFAQSFSVKRAGTRVFSNVGMWAAVVAFYTIIPKLYNMGLKHDPGLKGLEEESKNEQPQSQNNKGKDVAFKGGFASEAGKIASKDGVVSKLLSRFEFNGASMSVPAMLTLLFGFCLPPRYINAKSNKERKEILVRDVSSFVAILFAAKAMSRGFSNVFSKISGLALNVKPKDHNKNFLTKVKNYVTAGEGVSVLSSRQIVSKYSNIGEYKDGINGFFKFLEENGGDIKKVLNIDKGVKENAEQIMQKYGKQELSGASAADIKKAFENARKAGSDSLENIYSVFSKKDNKFVNRAKTLNRTFDFASIIVLVPAFMMWLARYCENMTKKAIAKEKEMKAKTNNARPIQQQIPPVANTKQPSMAGFLNK